MLLHHKICITNVTVEQVKKDEKHPLNSKYLLMRSGRRLSLQKI